MLRYFLNWFGAWKSKARLSSSVARMERKIDRLHRECIRQHHKAVRQLEDLDTAEAELDATVKKFKKDLEKARNTLHELTNFNKKLDEGMEAVRDQLKTAEDITIPGLVAAHDVLVKQWETQSKIEVMRQVMTTGKEND